MTPYQIDRPEEIFSPGLIFFRDIIEENLKAALEIAGSASRLCPHVKTHKTREIVRMERAIGIQSNKAATIAEAEMLAQEGMPEVVIAYPLVGPNLLRLVRLIQKYPQTQFSVLVDNLTIAQLLEDTLSAHQVTCGVWLDLNVGQNRTGILPTEEAVALYQALNRFKCLQVLGLHVYDGHNHAVSYELRQELVVQIVEQVREFRSQLAKLGLKAPRVIAGGTPSFRIWAEQDLEGLQCSPGTFTLYDVGYGNKFEDLGTLRPAAVLLTRVVSLPSPGRITLDLGHKAVAADPPAGQRCTILGIDDYTVGPQNEEHLTIDLPNGHDFRPGDELLAIPTHICPTVALHQFAYILQDGKLVEQWEIAARNRVITV
ncbi:MAG: D-TA family PLP-dependent enzyme [Zavarzinella sp.]